MESGRDLLRAHEEGAGENDRRLEHRQIARGIGLEDQRPKTAPLGEALEDDRATEKRAEISNRQVDAMEAEAITPAVVADLERLSLEEADLLSAAAAACRDYVSDQAGL